MSPALQAATPLTATAAGEGGGTGGLTGFVLDTVDALGAPGVGALSFLEVVFPPIPSEVVLPLAGYQVQQGRLGLVAVVGMSLVGALLGSLVLYWVGRVIGLGRAARIADRVPLMDASDVTKSAEWFSRHEGVAVFTGRFVPGVRSLISLPAGAARMSLWKFSLLTALGSGLWTGLLVGLCLALGTQYELVEQYGHYLGYVLYAGIAAVVVWAVGRRGLSGRAGSPAGPADAHEHHVER